jgi:hypothetical protein
VRSLETIYGLIKHVTTKFVQIQNFVIVLNEGGIFLEDVLHKALYLSKLKRPKKFFLVYPFLVGPKRCAHVARFKGAREQKSFIHKEEGIIFITFDS